MFRNQPNVFEDVKGEKVRKTQASQARAYTVKKREIKPND